MQRNVENLQLCGIHKVRCENTRKGRLAAARTTADDTNGILRSGLLEP